MTENIHIRLTRTPAGVSVNSHGSTKFYDNASWREFKRMIADFDSLNAPSIANLEEALPVRTPLHANAPCKHNWQIWPETDGQEQRCMKCGEYRKTPRNAIEDLA